MCMLGLSEMQEPWPCAGWILRVFVRILEKVKNRGAGKDSRDISQKSDDSAVNLPNANVGNSTEVQDQAGQQVSMLVDPAHGGDLGIGGSGMGLDGLIGSGQFSINDGSFMLNMENDLDDFFPGDLGQDFASQIPYYFQDVSMLNI